MHRPEHEEHHPHFTAQGFKNPRRPHHQLIQLQVKSHEADVDEIKSHHEEMIHAIGHLGVPVETIHQEHPPAPMKRSGHPDGHRESDAKIEGVGNGCFVHNFVYIGFSGITESW